MSLVTLMPPRKNSVSSPVTKNVWGPAEPGAIVQLSISAVRWPAPADPLRACVKGDCAASAYITFLIAAADSLIVYRRAIRTRLGAVGTHSGRFVFGLLAAFLGFAAVSFVQYSRAADSASGPDTDAAVFALFAVGLGGFVGTVLLLAIWAISATIGRWELRRAEQDSNQRIGSR